VEALIIVTFLFLLAVAIYFGVSVAQNSGELASYRRKFKHQESELYQAHLINRKLRIERDTLMELAVKYKRLAEQKPKAQELQFSKEQVQTLLMLCHPDKHGGKESATRITQVLIKMKETMK
jgi:5-bromo-4-chloroindolyl phosphate hydrolysis protein